MMTRASAGPATSGRSSQRDGVPPSSARLNLPQPADEDDGSAVYDPDEGFIQLGDGEDWPRPWGAARMGIP